jgi:parallel beta-helix repeat protein
VGVYICCASNHNYIGGTTPPERNVISGNSSTGLSVEGVERAFVLGNYIGTDATGTLALGNGEGGITIGETKWAAVQDNLVAGNAGPGVSISIGSYLNHLRANRIGVAADGSPLANDWNGVWVGSPSNVIGGLYPEDGNTIAVNSHNGVQVWAYPGNTIRRNSIYGNVDSGIYLADGGNNSLPAPVIVAVSYGSVSGTACPGCTVELFSDEEDEGRIYEGTVIADDSGNWTWTGSPTGPYVTATATDAAGNTSPFSDPQGLWKYWVFLPLVMRR